MTYYVTNCTHQPHCTRHKVTALSQQSLSIHVVVTEYNSDDHITDDNPYMPLTETLSQDHTRNTDTHLQAVSSFTTQLKFTL